MPGLIESQLGGDKKVFGAETEDYDPTLRAVDSGKETVAGQLHSLLQSGSPYLERAKAGAMQTANRRGLLNSSMAAGAGEAAAIDAALPIATADANAYTTAARDNQGFSNTAGQFNAGAKNTSNLNQAAAANQIGAIGAQGEESRKTAEATGIIESGLQAERAAQTQALQTLQGQQAIEQQTLKGTQETSLQNLRGEQAERLAGIETASRMLLQSSASATSMYNGITQNINNIMANPDITPQDKQIAIDRNIDLLESGLAILGGIGDLDLTALLDFSGSGVPAPQGV